MPEAEAEKGVLGELGGRAALFIGALYTIGLIIVNADLARYGIVNVELARPEYIIVGGLWLLLSFLGAAIVEGSRGEWDATSDLLDNLVPSLFVATIFVVLLLLCLALASIQSIFTIDGISLTLTIAVPPIVAVRVVDFACGGLNVQNWNWDGALLSIVVLFLALVLYALTAFPLLAAKFGGGRKPVVLVFLSEESSVPFAKYGIDVSNDRKIVGPALLVLKTDDAYVITGIESGRAIWHSLTILFRPTGNPTSSISVSKEGVSSVIYESDFLRSTALLTPNSVRSPRDSASLRVFPTQTPIASPTRPPSATTGTH